MTKRVPAFITRFSLSNTSAIGVQTERLLQAYPAAIHLYWESRDLTRQPSSSRRLEHLPVARWALFKRPGLPRRLLSRLGLTRWPHGRLDRATREQVRALRPTVSAVYVAPIGGEDAHRMRQLVELLGRPFVVHLWDMLEGGPDGNPDLAWLIANAVSVFGLTPTLLEASGRKDAIQLLFARGRARHRAQPPPLHGRLRIVAVGDVVSYQEGLSRLLTVSGQLRDAGADLEVAYIGMWGVFRRLPRPIRRQLVAIGYLAGDDARDAALAGCHLGFLPGPLPAPDTDFRSRYSIPSRILDYMATGLPMVGLVHPASATAGFARRFGVDNGLTADDAELAQNITALRDPDLWKRESELARSGAMAVEAEQPAAALADILRRLAETPDPEWALP